MNPPFRFEIAPSVLSGRRIKAGFHCHTVNADGGLSPEETAERYYSLGFQCLGITDHAMVTRVEEMPGAGFITIDSTENGGSPDVIGVGVREPVPRTCSLAERVKALSMQGGFTIAAHPAYCGALPCGYAACSSLNAMEIYNAYCDAAYANGYSLELWDMVLGLGGKIWGVAGDDAHLNGEKRYYSDAGLGWVEVWAAELSGEHVMRSLRNGFFFSTQGPVFDEIRVEENSLRVKCSPAEQVRWRTFGSVGFVDYASPGSGLVRSSLPDWFQPDKYVRIELVDRHGKKAWSNPFFVEEMLPGAVRTG